MFSSKRLSLLVSDPQSLQRNLDNVEQKFGDVPHVGPA
jgi:hypothetical protein